MTREQALRQICHYANTLLGEVTLAYLSIVQLGALGKMSGQSSSQRLRWTRPLCVGFVVKQSGILPNVEALPCSSGIEKLLLNLEMKMKSDIQISPCTSATIAAMHCSLSVPGMIYSIAQLLTCRLVYCFFERLKSNLIETW